MKTMKKIFSCALAALTFSSMSLISACTGGVEQKPTGGTPVGNTAMSNVKQGLHQSVMTATSKKMVTNGSTDYKIVLSANATESEEVAYSEFAFLFYEATGAKFLRVSDADCTYSADAKYVVLGNTSLNTAAGVSADVAEVKANGYVIKTVGNSIFIVGGTDEGTIFGVYDILEKLFDYDYYAPDFYTLQTNVRNLPLYNFDVKEAPDLDRNDAGYSMARASTMIARRYRQQRNIDVDIPIRGKYFGHNTINGYFPPDEYNNPENPEQYHPEWYCDGSTATWAPQLCYTAHGEEESYNLMVKTTADIIIEHLIEYPNATGVAIASEDNRRCCDCESCLEAEKQYGSTAGALIKYCNDVRALIGEWFEGDGKAYERYFEIRTLAYLAYEKAPVKYNEAGELYATIQCNDGVSVQIAPIYADYTLPFTHEENKPEHELLTGWSLVDDSPQWYLYDVNYSLTLPPYNTFDSMQKNFQLAFEHNVVRIYNLGCSGTTSAWGTLKQYLCGKLAWNVNIDMNYYITKFFENYFGEGSAEMLEWFNSWRAFAVYQSRELGLDRYNTPYITNTGTGTLYFDVNHECFWSLSLLREWKSLANAALTRIAPLANTDPERYEQLYNRIVAERLSLDYIMIEAFDSVLQEQEIWSLKYSFKADVEKTGVSLWKEGGTMNSSFWKSWGIQ